jgi:hypothetical protein
MDFMCSRRATLYLRRKAVIVESDLVRLEMMKVGGRVVMSNAAAARRLYTRGNNEAPLPTDFSDSDPYCTANTCG